jgi:hypothetical protein
VEYQTVGTSTSEDEGGDLRVPARTETRSTYSDNPNDDPENDDVCANVQEEQVEGATDNEEPDALVLRVAPPTAAARAADSQDHSARIVCGVKVTRRVRGMLAAAFCGLYGGSIMAPMRAAPVSDRGAHYLISFAVGAAVVNAALWILRWLYLSARRGGSLRGGYDGLPSFHWRVMWLAGGTSGLLWSIGNYFSLISVFYLGEGVGYPLVQTSILVSGLWGLFYFKEVTGAERISKWFASSLLTVLGILLLSYEHHEK